MRGGLPSLCFALLAGLLAIPMRAIVRVNPRLRIALFGLVALVAAALIPNGADAAFMSAEATFTTGQGDNCREGGSLDDLGEGTTTQSASFNCTNVEGFSQSQATASAGSVGASALAHSFAGVNRGSESSEGAQGIANYSDTTGVFNGT